MKRLSRLLPLLIFVVGSGCSKAPEGILPINKMKVVFLHHIMAEEMLNNYVARDTALDYDSARIALFSGVMKLNRTDSATFAKSINYYKADIGRFKELLDSVNALALREKENRLQVEAARARKKEVADSLARVDSIARIKKVKPDGKDSAVSVSDSLKVKKGDSAFKKESMIKPRQ